MEYKNNNLPNLMPKYQQDNLVLMEDMSPDWAKSLIICNFRIEMVTQEGTFLAAIKVLDHLQEMGVNGVWINPIYERSKQAPFVEVNGKNIENSYYVADPFRINHEMGTVDDLKSFIEAAHERNIRIFLDLIPHGVSQDSPLVTEHPDWFQHDNQGEIIGTWNMYDFDFIKSKSCRQWFIQGTVDYVIDLNVDGLRCDVEPFVSGTKLIWQEVRRRCFDAGRKIIIFSEHPSDRDQVFDFEEIGVGQGDPGFSDSHNYFLENNIVDCIKKGQTLGANGKKRLYTFALSDHDSPHYWANGSLLNFGYQAIFAPVIPLFYIGEEWNNITNTSHGLYWATIEWDLLKNKEHTLFYENVKKMIKIRRQNANIFEFFPEDHTQTNICKIEVEGSCLQSYARYADGVGIMIIANEDKNDDKLLTFKIPFEEMQLNDGQYYQLIDLMSGEILKLQEKSSLI